MAVPAPLVYSLRIGTDARIVHPRQSEPPSTNRIDRGGDDGSQPVTTDQSDAPAVPVDSPAGRAGRNTWIDVVRGLAIFGVVAVHSAQAAHTISHIRVESVFTQIAELGVYGVEVFFFISGWLLSSIYERDTSRTLRSYGYWPKRIARIYPLWVLFLIIAILWDLVPWNGHVFGWDLRWFAQVHPGIPGYLVAVVMMLTFTPWMSGTLWNNVIPGGWSIQAEIASYTFFPFLRRVRLEIVIAVLLVINVVTMVLERAHLAPGSPANWALNAWVRLDFYSTIFYFLVGVLAARLLRGAPDLATIRARLLAIPARAAIIGIAYVTTVLYVPLWFGNNPTGIGLVAASLVVAALIERTRLIRWFFLVVGKYSYFIYFFHVLGVTILVQAWTKFVRTPTGIFRNESVDFVLIFVLAWVVSIPLGWLSFRFIESPFMRLASRKTRRPRAGADPANG
jgi:peptidoglycan/LPS O-acetylase OafA/YrhL